MKKKTAANLIMMLIIAAIAAGGCLLALHLKEEKDTGLGGQYQITALPGEALTEAGQKCRCSITIVCHTVVEAPERLEEEKRPYVPEDGVILPRTEVSFAEGDTVFQVLQKVCAAADIPLEYSWTPAYDSYYVEGIQHLYEFDCGPESGWMYQVNGQFPNYGCSSYALTGGEEIVWCYTCVGLGEDVGGSV